MIHDPKFFESDSDHHVFCTLFVTICPDQPPTSEVTYFVQVTKVKNALKVADVMVSFSLYLELTSSSK